MNVFVPAALGAAAISVLTPGKPNSQKRHPSPSNYHRWSTAAARGHSRLPPEKLDQAFLKQYHAAMRVKPIESFAGEQALAIASLRDGQTDVQRVSSKGEALSAKVDSKVASASLQTPNTQASRAPCSPSDRCNQPDSIMLTPKEVFAPSRFPPPMQKEERGKAHKHK